MSEKETNGASPPGEHSNGSAPVVSSTDRSDWDRKLSEARAKREKVLSARAMAQSPKHAKTRKDIPKPLGMPPKKRVEPSEVTSDQTEAERLKFTLSGANALKALFVFCAAAGFGVGTVVGFAVLVGLGVTASDVNETEQVVVQPVLPAENEIETSTLASVETSTLMPVDQVENSVPKAEEVIAEAPELQVMPEADETPISMYAGGMPALPEMLDKDVELFVEPEDFANSERPVSFPEFTNVRYMRDDLEATQARGLRTLPDLGASTTEPTNEGEIAEVTADDRAEVTDTVEPKYFIHAPDGLTDDQLGRYIARLEGEGVAVSDIGREGFRVSTTHLRYYSPATAEAAQTLAKDMGIEARDFSQNERNSARIEIWLAGRPKAALEEEAAANGVFYWLRGGQREER